MKSCGTPIYASAAGTVTQIQPTSGSGGYWNRTVIGHTEGWFTTYNNQSAIQVQTGQQVAQGDQ
ncbi:MAG: M23 family metallopeptidase, partial [Bifidobacteriaceae bacterium]|nr:M23 family metallopeptidase [Bifidobacteriaceae bacterium]